jgi:hypothetical protein
MACIAVGTPPLNGTRSAMFGASIRVKNKDDLQKFRYDQLKRAYHVTAFTQNNPDKQKVGHCAETYPYICNMRMYVSVENYILNSCIIVII